MSWIFFICSSLTSLNLSNFNTKNVINMMCLFEGVNIENCKLICNDAIILEKFNKI
jgi:surface protein